MIHRINLRELWDLSPRESAKLNDRHGEYLSQQEASRERRRREARARAEIEAGVSGLSDGTHDNQGPERTV